MTHYERIRNMNIDDLAKEIDKCEGLTDEICNAETECPYMDEDGNFSEDVNCIGCIKKWLESEVKE